MLRLFEVHVFMFLFQNQEGGYLEGNEHCSSTESAFVLPKYPEIEMPRRFKVHVFTFLFQNQEGGCMTIHN